MHTVKHHLSLCFFIFLSLFSSTSVLAASEINVTRSRLVQLALHLEVADPELKYEFYRIALIEMYNTYLEELNKSYTNLPRNPKKRAKVRRWGYATHDYLEYLDQYFFQLDSGSAMDFYVNRQNKIVIFIEGESPVIISGPNPMANKQIEYNIVEQFCQLYDCIEYFERTHYDNNRPLDDTDVEGIDSDETLLYGQITGTWNIKKDMQADFVTTSGVVVEFSSLKNRSFKEQWALDIANEIEDLINGLDNAQRKGNKIQWTLLNMNESSIADNTHKIIINSKGDFIKLSLPLIRNSKTLFQQLVPWIKTRFEKNRNSPIIINNAEKYSKK